MSKSDAWGGTTWLVGASPFVGYLIPLGERIALWPKVGGSYFYYSNAMGQSSRSIGIGASLPVVAHLAPNFFVGAGPDIGFNAWSSDDYGERSTSVISGFGTMIGGWI